MTALFLFSLPLSSQEPKPRVSVIPLFTGEGNSTLSALGNTVTETADLTLRLLDRYEISTEETPPEEPDQLAGYAERGNIDSVIFGEIRPEDNGSYTIALNVFDRASGSVSITREVVADSILDIFDATDILVPELIGGFSGQHIGYGSLIFTNTGFEAPYKVYIDHALVGDNITNIPKLLYGSHTIRLTAMRDREIELVKQPFDLEEGGEVSFSFDIPYLTEETMNQLGEAEEAVFLGMDKVSRRQEVLKRILEIQGLVKAYAGSLSLDELKLKSEELTMSSYRSYIYRTEILPVAYIVLDGSPEDWRNVPAYRAWDENLKDYRGAPVNIRYMPEYLKLALSPQGDALQIGLKMRDEKIYWPVAQLSVSFTDHRILMELYKESGRWYTKADYLPTVKNSSGKWEDDWNALETIFSGKDGAVNGSFCEFTIPFTAIGSEEFTETALWLEDNGEPEKSWYGLPTISLREESLEKPVCPGDQPDLRARQEGLLESFLLSRPE